MPYLGYLLAQAVKAGETITSAISSAASYVSRVGGSVVELSPSDEALKSPSAGSGSFNGTSEYILLKSDGKGSSFDTQKFSISAWVNAKTFGDNVIWSYDFTNHSNPYYAQQLRLLGDGDIYFSWNNGSGLQSIETTSTGYYTTNNWYHIAVTFENNSQKMYVNGSEVGSRTLSTTITYHNQEVWIGKGNFGGYFDGNLTNVAFWSRALDASEIRSVMNKSYDDLNASETKGLVSWYALDDITGTTVPDSHGNNPGTAS